MKIKINVKGASRRKASVVQMVREYPDRQMTVEEFLAETVRMTVAEYNERKDAAELLHLFEGTPGEGSAEKAEKLPKTGAKDSASVEKAFEERLEAGAAAGKVAYGDPMDGRKANAEKAVKNALQCFDDGIVALFADGARYTDRKEQIPLKEQSEVTFVRLTFLAGRMW